MNRLTDLTTPLRAKITPAHRLPLLVSAIGLVAALASWTICSLDGHLITNLDWALYDLWSGHQRPASAPPILLVESTASAQDAHAPVVWDRAVMARAIGALSQANASAIGLADYFTVPSGPEQGGAAGDALLAASLADSERVVLAAPLLAHAPGAAVSRPSISLDMEPAHAGWGVLSPQQANRFLQAAPLTPLLPSLREAAAFVTHDVGFPDADGQWRRLPLVVELHDRLVPALGLGLFLKARAAHMKDLSIVPGSHLSLSPSTSSDTGTLATIPIDARAQVLLPRLGHPVSNLQRVELGHLLQAMHRKDHEQIRTWAENRIVLLPSTIGGQDAPVRSEQLTRQLTLLESLLNPSLSAARLRTPWVLGLAWILAASSAWCLLRWKDWRGLIGAILLMAVLLVLAWLGLAAFRTTVPLGLPAIAVVLASFGSLLWNHLMSGAYLRELERNVRRVQAELAAVREALICQESSVEQLEEDLEEARAREARAANREQALTLSASEVQRELDQARTHEQNTRAQLAALERELAGLRGASLRQDPLPEAELETLRLECERLGIFTRDARLLGTVRDLKRGASSLLPVLILGESGTGKELFARAVHRLSPRHAHPFIAVNMAAISHELFESELFGHVRGSFSGATQDRQGFFEMAARGTIFLDEIGDLRPEHQAKLLRVLQEKSFYRVGATKPTSVDVRIVAATNKDLVRGIAEGWFREDLYARLKGLVVSLPPLRERAGDLPALAQHVLARAARLAQRSIPGLTQEAMAALQRYPWPHNVRELEQCLEQAVALSESPLIGASDLRLPLPASGPLGDKLRPSSALGDVTGDAAVLDCLRGHAFDMQATARALGWDRSTVTQRLKGLCFQALVDCDGDKAKAATLLAQDPSLVRTVELKLIEYADHLTTVVSTYASPAEAIQACRKRFKNLPDRHFKAVETLIRHHFAQRGGPAVSPPPSSVRAS